MQELPIFVAGLVLGILLAVIAQLVRSRGVTDVGGPSGAAPGVATPPVDPTTDTAALPDSGLRIDRKGLHLKRTTVLHRIAARVEPGGSLTITVDGQTYHRLEDLPDAAMRERVRGILAGLPSDVKDPALHEKVVAELEDAGIDPEP